MGRKHNLSKKDIFLTIFWILLIVYFVFNFNFLNLYLNTILFFTKNYIFYFIISYYIIYLLSFKFMIKPFMLFLTKLILQIFYVIFFPLIKLFSYTANFIIYLYRNKNIYFKHSLHFLFLLFFLIFYSAIVTFSNQYILMISVFCLLISLLFYQIFLLYWFNDPELFIHIPEFFLKKYPEEEIFKKALFEYKILHVIKFLLNQRLWFFIYIIGFIYGFILIVLNYTFVYYGLTKINNLNFIGLESNSFLGHLYFTMTNFSTINSVEILPSTFLAKIVVVLQIFSAILFFTIIIVSFSFTFSKNREELLKKVNLRIKKIKGD